MFSFGKRGRQAAPTQKWFPDFSQGWMVWHFPGHASEDDLEKYEQIEIMRLEWSEPKVVSPGELTVEIKRFGLYWRPFSASSDCSNVEGVLPKDDLGSVSVADNERDAWNSLLENHRGSGFLAPKDLSVASVQLKRIALVGSCFLESLAFVNHHPLGADIDIFTTNNLGGVPQKTAEEIALYDFQVVQVPLRAIFGDDHLWRIGPNEDDRLQHAFDETCARLEMFLKDKMSWNIEFGMTTFVCNFMVPQQNPLGRLFRRYHLSNVEYFVERINAQLEAFIREYKNAYILDIDRISASVGRRYVQDDSITSFSHGSIFSDFHDNIVRIEPLVSVSEQYDVRWHGEFLDSLWAEINAMYRTIRQADSVKLVAVDLDDTIWNGVSGDIADVGAHMIEGWPIGFAEALMYLKKRGVLLAIISKNEESRIREIWEKIFCNRLRLEDFAAVSINWEPKTENMRSLLAGMNILPRSVVFIDDNPVERGAMQLAFPDMRILGRHPYYLRRILLGSSETQVVSITEESSRRTEMIQAQFEREGQRQGSSREEFLRSAAPQVTISQITETDHPRFPRAFELINKTNQFNTTGKRWTTEQVEHFFHNNGKLYTFEATDRYTSYGLVGVVVVEKAHIVQYVMSCRVLGYNIEEAALAVIIADIRGGGPTRITATLIETDVNFPCRDLFAKSGFFNSQLEIWEMEIGKLPVMPSHVIVHI